MTAMKFLAPAAAGAASCLLVAALVLSATSAVAASADKDVVVTNGAANPVPVTVTNPDRPSGRQVTLVHLAPSSAGYVQQLATGESTAGDYVIPAGQILVITDIEVTFRRGSGEAGQSASYFLENTDSTVGGTAIRARLHATLNAEGDGEDDRHLQTGILFPSTSTLKDSLPASSFDAAVLRGYLVPQN